MSRWLLVAALLAAFTASARAQQPAADPGLAAVPTGGFAFVSVRVSKLWDNPAAKPVRDWVATQKDGMLEAMVGVPFADVDRVTLFMPTLPGRGDEGEPVMVVTTRQKYSEANVLKALGRGLAGNEQLRLKGRVTVLPRRLGNLPFRSVVLAGDRMLVFAPQELDEKQADALLAQLSAPKKEGILSEGLALAHKHDIAMSLNVIALEGQLMAGPAGRDRDLDPFRVLLKARTATLAADVGQTVKGKLVLSFLDEESAKQAAPALEDGMTLIAAEFARQFQRTFRRDREEEQVEQIFLRWGLRLWKSTRVSVDGRNAVITADVPFEDDLAKLVKLLPKSLKDAAIDTVASNNLKQIGLAMHNFHDANNRFPADVDFQGRAMSWRVQILPYIEQDNLYKQLDHTKPWDDPKNLKALQAMEMPKIFEHPGRKAPKGHTFFRVFTLPRKAKGNNQPLFVEGGAGVKIFQITDGTSNTFMVVEANEAVPWYKPDVLAYDGKLPLPGLGDKEADAFHVLFCDGSVQKLKPSKLGEKTIRALITPNGGEIVNIPR